MQLGGATAKIGDPSGRMTERDEMLSASIDENLIGIKTDIESICRNHEAHFLPAENARLKPVT